MVPEYEDFSFEITISDLQRVRRRVNFTSKVDEVLVNEFYVNIPNHFIRRRVWLNLYLDVKSFFSNIYKSNTYRAIESIEISAHCKIRKIFPLNNSQSQVLQLVGQQSMNGEQLGLNGLLPQQIQFPMGVYYEHQIGNFQESIADAQVQIIQLAQQNGYDLSQNLKKRLSPSPKFQVGNFQQEIKTKVVMKQIGSDDNLTDKISFPEINKQNKRTTHKFPINQTPKNNKKISYQNQSNMTHLYSEANTTISTRKKSIPSAHSHVFVSTDENFQHDQNSDGGFQEKKQSSQQPIHKIRQKKSTIKQHPLSAVQKSTKLGNNLYSIVNNKLVYNIKNKSKKDGLSELTDQDHSIDRLLPKEFSPSTSEEKIFTNNLKSAKLDESKSSFNNSSYNNQPNVSYFGKKPNHIPRNKQDKKVRNTIENTINEYPTNHNQSPDELNIQEFVSSRSNQSKRKHNDNGQSQQYQFVSKYAQNAQFTSISPIRGAEVVKTQYSDNFSDSSFMKIPQIFNNKTNLNSQNRAWYEESIREENEYAEADEQITTTQKLYGLQQIKKVTPITSSNGSINMKNHKITNIPNEQKVSAQQTANSTKNSAMMNNQQSSSQQRHKQSSSIQKNPYSNQHAGKGSVSYQNSSNNMTMFIQQSENQHTFSLQERLQHLREKKQNINEIEQKYKKLTNQRVIINKNKSELQKLSSDQSAISSMNVTHDEKKGYLQEKNVNKKKSSDIQPGLQMDNRIQTSEILNYKFGELKTKGKTTQQDFMIKEKQNLNKNDPKYSKITALPSSLGFSRLKRKSIKKENKSSRIHKEEPVKTNKIYHLQRIDILTYEEGSFNFFDYNTEDKRFATSIFNHNFDQNNGHNEDEDILSIEEKIEKESNQTNILDDQSNKIYKIIGNNDEENESEDDQLFYKEIGNLGVGFDQVSKIGNGESFLQGSAINNYLYGGQKINNNVDNASFQTFSMARRPFSPPFAQFQQPIDITAKKQKLNGFPQDQEHTPDHVEEFDLSTNQL